MRVINLSNDMTAIGSIPVVNNKKGSIQVGRYGRQGAHSVKGVCSYNMKNKKV